MRGTGMQSPGHPEVGGPGGLETEADSSYGGLEYRWGASLVERI